MRDTKLSQFRRAWLDVFFIMRRELQQIFTDRVVVMVFFLATIIYPMVVGYIYKREMMRDMAVGVADLSQTSLSREYIRMLDATPEVKVTHVCGSMEEAKHLQKTRQTHGTIFIPKDFSHKINAREQTHIGVYNDMSSFFFYRNLMLASSNTALELGGQIQVKNLLAQGKTYQEALVQSQPFVPREILLYNPGGYPSFLLPAVLILVLQQTLLIGIAILAGKTAENNKGRRFIPYNEAHYQRGVFRLIGGKSFAYLVIYIPIVVLDLIIIPRFFNIPQLQLNSFAIFGFILPFLLSCIFLGMSLSVLFKNRDNAIPVYLFTSILLLLISGISWPEENIPIFWKYIGLPLPSTYGIQGFSKMTIMGADPMQISETIFKLWVLAGIYFVIALLSYAHQLRLVLKDRNREKIQAPSSSQ